MRSIAIASIALAMMAICQPMLSSANHGAPASAAATTGPNGVTTASASVGQPQHAYPAPAYPPAYPVVQGPAPVYYGSEHGYHPDPYGHASHGYGHGYNSGHNDHGYNHGHNDHGYNHGHDGHGYNHHAGHHQPGIHGQAGFNVGPHSANVHGSFGVQAPQVHHHPGYNYKKPKYSKQYYPQPAVAYPSHGHGPAQPVYYDPNNVAHGGPVLHSTPKKNVQTTSNQVFVTNVEAPRTKHRLMGALAVLAPFNRSRPVNENHNRSDKINITQGTNVST